MSALLDELAGPVRHIRMRALPLLRLAATPAEDLDGVFGDQGEQIALVAAEGLSHPTKAVEFLPRFGRLREAVDLFERFHAGLLTASDGEWTADEVAGEVLGPLSWLLNGAEACKACFAVAYNAAMIRGRADGQVCCTRHVTEVCQPHLIQGGPVRPAVLVVQNRGYCGPCSDRAPVEIFPKHLTSIAGGAA